MDNSRSEKNEYPTFTPLTCHIVEYFPKSRIFKILVWNTNCPQLSWVIFRRYSEFYRLYQDISGEEFKLKIPPKLINIISLTQYALIERKECLANFCLELLKHRFLGIYRPVVIFFCHETLQNLKQEAKNHAEKLFTRTQSYCLGKECNFGWRIKKFFFTTRLSKNLPENYLTVLYTEKNFFSNPVIHPKKILKFIDFFDSEFIHKPLDFIIDLTICFIYENNSKCLTDIIYSNSNYLKKMAERYDSQSKPLSKDYLIKYSQEIYEAITYLHNCGIIHGNIHTGNIVIQNDRAKLFEITGMFAEMVHRDINFFMKQVHFDNPEQIDIMGYAQVIYEMMYGKIPDTSFKPPISNYDPDLKELENFLSTLINRRKLAYLSFKDIVFSTFEDDLNIKLPKKKPPKIILKKIQDFTCEMFMNISNETQIVNHFYEIMYQKPNNLFQSQPI